MADRSPDPRLWNPDLAPVPAGARTWAWWHVAALWVGMAVCVTTYTLASSLIGRGMNWWQATLTIFLGNLIVLVPMTLPVAVITRFGSPWLSAIALVTLAVATLSTNIAANVVSPANDFTNLAPRLVTFRTGGLITAAIGVVMMPWKLYEDPTGYVFTWLIGYSALLGPIAGIMIADYFVWRRCRLDVDGLYGAGDAYRYCSGFSLVAFAALALAVAPNLPGFLVRTGAAPAAAFPAWLVAGYDYAWFVGFALGFLVYSCLRPLFPNR